MSTTTIEIRDIDRTVPYPASCEGKRCSARPTHVVAVRSDIDAETGSFEAFEQAMCPVHVVAAAVPTVCYAAGLLEEDKGDDE